MRIYSESTSFECHYKFSAKMEPLVIRMTGSSTNVTALEQVIMDQNANCQARFSQ